MLVALDRFEEADPYCVAAFEVHEAFNPDHIGTLYSLTHLGTLRRLQGRAEEAASLLRDSVERTTRILGPDHPLTVDAAEQLAKITGPGSEQEP